VGTFQSLFSDLSAFSFQIYFARAFSFPIYFAMVRLKYTRPLYSSEIDNNPFFGNAPLRLLNLGHYQKCLKVNYKIFSIILYQIIKVSAY